VANPILRLARMPYKAVARIPSGSSCYVERLIRCRSHRPVFRARVLRAYGIGGEVAISTPASTSIGPPRTTSPSRILKKRKCQLIPMRNNMVAR
jgi:hypothetical protein